MESINATIKERVFLNDTTVEVRFKPKAPLKFLAGQYISVTLPTLSDLPLPEQFHDFSLSSPPHQKNYISVSFRISTSTFKQTLLHLAIGSQVQIEGPRGIFTLPAKKNSPFVFVAGGIGITPFRSILLEQAHHASTQIIDLLYFNSSPAATVYADELAKTPSCKLHSYYEKPTTDSFKTFHDQMPTAMWYIAGPPAFVASCRSLLQDLAIANAKIMTEDFAGYESYI